MKKTARVIITSKCDRKCPGCCNSKLDYTSLAKVIGGITALKDYEEVVITGGEPMINPAQLYTVIKMLRKQNKRQKIYLYTACLTMDDHPVILKHLDGITVTVHAEATDEDIRNLKYMSSNLYDEDLDMRLFIDKRVYDRYDLSNICMENMGCSEKTGMERKVRSGRKRRTVFVESLLRRLPWKLIELYQLQTEKAIRELRADTLSE